MAGFWQRVRGRTRVIALERCRSNREVSGMVEVWIPKKLLTHRVDEFRQSENGPCLVLDLPPGHRIDELRGFADYVNLEATVVSEALPIEEATE